MFAKYIQSIVIYDKAGMPKKTLYMGDYVNIDTKNEGSESGFIDYMDDGGITIVINEYSRRFFPFDEIEEVEVN